MPELTIRRAGPQDAATISDIARRTFTETFGHLYDPSDLKAFLEESYDESVTRTGLGDPEKAYWLVEAQGAAVGHALAGPCELPHPDVSPTCRELKRFYLLKSHQNGGTGTRLWTEILAWLERDGAHDLWIGVWSENFGAQKFYGRHGFEKVGEYGFAVGQTIDREFILKRPAVR